MGYEMMGNVGAMGGWGMVFGGLMMIVWVALLVTVVVLLVRWLSGSKPAFPPIGTARTTPAQAALALLQDRYAKGEIDTKEFDERSRKLREGLTN